MIEQIKWHPYPKEKPPLNAYIICQDKRGKFYHTFYKKPLLHGQPAGKPIIFWCEYNADKHCYEDHQPEIIAWALDLKGMQED